VASVIFTSALLATRSRRSRRHAAATSSPPAQQALRRRAETGATGAARRGAEGRGAKEGGALGDAKEMAQSMAAFFPFFKGLGNVNS